MEERSKISQIRWMLVLYDIVVYAIISWLLLYLHPSQDAAMAGGNSIVAWMGIGAVCIFLPRFILAVYKQILRYGDLGAYLRLIAADAIGAVFYVVAIKLAPVIFPNLWETQIVRTVLAITIVASNLLAGITMRMLYYIMYRNSGKRNALGSLFRGLLNVFGRMHVKADSKEKEETENHKTRVAIVGAGRVGTSLVEELLSNPKSGYKPVCFIENDQSKIGRKLLGLPVIYENSSDSNTLTKLDIHEIIMAIPEASNKKKTSIYERFKDAGIRIKTYDYPIARDVDGSDRMEIRQFTIEELLARKPVILDNEIVNNYYKGKVAMVTGGGGSIGSELCRQLVAMGVKQLIILDIAENSTYELQQDLRMQYGGDINLAIEICTVCNRDQLDKIFKMYKPQIVLHAAAHKHVPLMEHNSVECIENNVYGTKNVIDLAIENECEHFILVSTDKAVNPTNVMGASKRICEMMVMNAASKNTKTIFSATRFGNVLGSAGSVVPLFRKQIAKGGPVTVTHKDITRYFMTIPEASSLVLTSGQMAENGELFVLDMGKPVRIYELAENMIRLSGYIPNEDIMIEEAGLRPGEKLYEELLISGENQGKTENELIFIERDEPISNEEMERCLALLKEPVDNEDDEKIKEVLPLVVPTYKRKE